MSAAPSDIQLVWFKRDLRIADHAALSAAAACGPVLPVFIIEPGYWAEPDASGRQYAFLSECLDDLDAALGALGQRLILRTGEAVSVLAELAAQTGARTLWSHEETGNDWTYARDRAVGAWAAAAGVEWRECRQSGVIRRLKSRNGWARKWDGFTRQAASAPPSALRPVAGVESERRPAAGEIGLAPDACPKRQAGGREQGLNTLESFLTERGQPYRKAMSSPGPGAEHCSRLSPYLAWGALSIRETAQAGRRRQSEIARTPARDSWSGSMKSFMSRLAWRDHFMQKLEDEPRLEFENMHPAYDGMRPDQPDRDKLRAWAEGETGMPFVDACMRALKAAGWMNFRMRAMLMSVASYHLWLPWRESGLVLARYFTDYEPGIHWPQTQMQSGVTGVNSIRIYNPVKQGFDQDPDGAFMRRWLPELADLPAPALHEPWRHEAGRARLGRSYPEPVVDIAAAARFARETVHAVRKGGGFRDSKKTILAKHGSRARPPAERRRRARAEAARQSQMTLDL